LVPKGGNMASGGLPANFSFKKRKGKKRKARKFDIGAQLRKEAQPVKIEKTAEEKAAEAVVTQSDWQEDPVQRKSKNSFKSKFGSIQKIDEDRKKPQEHVLKRKTREDGRAIIQNVILAAKEVKKKEPEKEETKPKLGAYRPGSWMQRAKKKTQFKITEEAFPSMNPNAASASTAAAKSVWAPAAKVAEKEKPTAQTAEKPTAQKAEKPTAQKAENPAAQTKPVATSTPGEDTESAPAIAPVQTTEEKPPVPEADPKASAATAAPPKKNKFKKKKKKKKKKAADGPVATATEAATAAEPANTEEAAAKPAETEAAAAKPAEAASDTNSAPATSVPDTETNVVKKKKLNKFKKKKKKKKKKEGAV